MSIKPILFNTEMVRAILEDRKTATRRVVKPQPQGRLVSELPGSCWPGYFSEEGTPRVVRPPYFPGDILYVREAWARLSDLFDEPSGYIYRADFPQCDLDELKRKKFRWRPSIHMPREAARIFLRATDVRVERLQDITANGIRAEGMEFDVVSFVPSWIQLVNLWDSTIKKTDRALYGWDANPWVWVIEFERCEKPESAS